MVAFLFYIQRFFDPIRSLTMQYSVMQRAMASGHRITEVLDVPSGVEDRPGAVALGPDMDGSVEFRGVTFGYDPRHPVLHDVSFRVNPGETVALVGPTGSGKSSCMALAHRFYDVQQGEVRVGGHDVREVDAGVAGAADRDGAAGAVPLHRDGVREHPLPQARRRRATRSSPRRRRSARTTSSWRCRTATTPTSASAAAGCRSGSGSS